MMPENNTRPQLWKYDVLNEVRDSSAMLAETK